MKEDIKLSILILTHNAPTYVKETIETLNKITNPEDLKNTEIIVVDNNSDNETKEILFELKNKKYIDKLYCSDINHFFAKGNNLASELVATSTEMFLLLNSDIKIKNPKWLSYLINKKNSNNYNIASLGAVNSKPFRADGYCFLIDRNLYDKFKLDENFQWWWSVTKLQAEVLKDGGKIIAMDYHDNLIYHYGGKSGQSFKDAKGMDIEVNDIIKWFDGTNSIKFEFVSIVGFVKGKISSYINKIKLKIKKTFRK